MNEDQPTPEQIEEQRQKIWDELEAKENGEPTPAADEPAKQDATQDSNESAAQAADAPGAEPAKPADPVLEKVSAMEQTLGSLMNRLRASEGHIGNLNSTIKSLRESKPQGEAPTVAEMKQAAQSDKAMAKLLEDYPELGATFKEVLESREASMQAQVQELLAKNKPEGAVSREEIDQMRRELAVEVAHPGWSREVATPEFNAWLEAQPREVRLLAGSDDPQDAIRLLDLRKQASKPANAGADKTQRLASAAAVQTTRSGSSIRQKPIEEMTKQEYWDYLEEQERKQAARA